MVTPENLEEDLREACAMGDESKVQSLIVSGAKVNNANKMNGWTPLHWASYRGHRNIVMILLNKGADPSLKNNKGEAVLDLLSGHTLDLLMGNEVEEASQYPVPEHDLPIVPNYISNPEFPYTKKDNVAAVLPSAMTMNPHDQNEGESKLNDFFKGLMEKMQKEKGDCEEASVVPTPMDTGSGSSSPRHAQGVAVTAEPRREHQPAVKLTANRPYIINPIPNPALINPQISQPQLGRQFIPYRHTTYQGQTFIPNTPNIARFNNSQGINQVPQMTHMEPYPVQHRTYNTPNNPNMYNTRPVQHHQQHQHQQHQQQHQQQYEMVVPRPMMHPHRHMLSRIPVPTITPVPTVLQPQTPPRSEEAREYITPTRKSPPTSPNSTQSTPPASDATLKVRKAGTCDFFEVDLTDIGDTYVSLVKCFAEELELDENKVSKVRKLPNILIRKDRDVKRIKAGAEFEVELLEPDS